MKTIMLAAALLSGAVTWAGAATAANLPNEGPGSFMSVPADSRGVYIDDDNELTTDLEFLIKAGYQSPDYEAYYNLRRDVARNIIVPDYVARNGKLPPEDSMIEIAAVYITGGDFNDLLVFSHMPGDCNDNGCLAQLYRTVDGLKWDKVLEFTALAFAYKSPDKETPAEAVSVGNSDVPSAFYTWNGKSFDLRK